MPISYLWPQKIVSRPIENELELVEVATITGHKDIKNTDALYAFRSRGFGGEVGYLIVFLTPH